MPENHTSVRIAVNIMRSRLTVIGFNIAIVSFQIAQLYKISGGISVPGVNHSVHVTADVDLYMALALSLISMIAFIMSCELDEVGICSHWTLLAGDLLMYMALAYTVAGFFAPLGESIRSVGVNLPSKTAETMIVEKTILVTSGIAWFLAMYIGPLVSLLRSPFSKAANWSLGLIYLFLVLTLAWVNVQAAFIEFEHAATGFSLAGHFLLELLQPLQW